jgi:hypothetical protein
MEEQGQVIREMVDSELGIALLLLAPADCLPLTADCLLRLRGV